jgi:hypothetical protein
MPILRRDARLELDAPLRTSLSPSDRQAIASLLQGARPSPAPPHPFFALPQATKVFSGSSLDHATSGSRVTRDGADHRLQISSSFPPVPALLPAALSWLSSLVDLIPGDIGGFIVPAGAPRHDMRLLIWDGASLQPLSGVPNRRHTVDTGLTPECSDAAFRTAAALPPAAEATRQEAQQLALGLISAKPPLINWSLLDGPLPDGAVVRLREWLITYAAIALGLSAEPPPPLVHLA